jgi:hypothetical protein
LRDKIKSRVGDRRSQRVTLRVPVVVSASETGNGMTFERTHTIAVNRHGGLIALHASVAPGQNLLLTNSTTRQSKECRVVYLGPNHLDKRQVGVEFTDPVTDFWNMSFPAPGSKPILE